MYPPIGASIVCRVPYANILAYIKRRLSLSFNLAGCFHFHGHSKAGLSSMSSQARVQASNADINLRGILLRFQGHDERVSIIIECCDQQQQLEAAGVAHEYGMSFVMPRPEHESSQPVIFILSKCEILPTPEVESASGFVRHAASQYTHGNPDWGGFIDLRFLAIDGIAPEHNENTLRACFQFSALPVPEFITIKDGSEAPRDTAAGCHERIAYICYNDYLRTVLVYKKLHRTVPTWNGTEGRLSCDFIHFPSDFEHSLADFGGDMDDFIDYFHEQAANRGYLKGAEYSQRRLQDPQWQRMVMLANTVLR